jgi:glycosyltransferase involved in cell wall biosynthesis
VIVPTHDRPAALRRCLDALAAQRHRSFEVVVVDDGGSVPLEPILAEFSDRIELVLLRQAHAGPSGARNHGAAHARGSVLAFTDDDCRPDPDWLRWLTDRCDAVSGAGAGGRTVNELTSAAWSEVAQLVVDLGYATANRDPADARFFAANNLALPAAGFHAIGGFDSSFATAEDRDLCERWRASGRGLLSVPEAIVRHAHHLDLRQFFSLHAAYGRGAYSYHRARARRAGQLGLGRGWIDRDYYRRAARIALNGGVGYDASGLAFRLGVWQLANTLGFATAWATRFTRR